MDPRRRFALVFAATALAAYVLAGCTGESEFYARADADEANRLALDHEGQSNCVAEALRAAPTDACPLEPTGEAHPSAGILVLDDFYVQHFAANGVDSTLYYAENPNAAVACAADPRILICAGPLQSWFAGANTARSSNGELPDIILPGAGRFVAAFGWWNNADLDDFIHVDDTATDEEYYVRPGPNNEFVPKDGSRLVSYVEPGTHPSYDGMMRPGPDEPDIRYVLSNALLASSPVLYTQTDGEDDISLTTAVIWVDGSLLRTYRVTTVSDAILAPSSDGRFPFSPSTRSRIDIDVYGAIAPGPVAALYETNAGPVMNEYASPSWGLCPNACIPGPVAAGGTPLDTVLGPTQGALFARHIPETEPGSLNTAEGRLADFQARHRAWIDLLPMTRLHAGYGFVPLAWTPSMQMPLGADPDGRPTIPPNGYFAPEAWLGLWRDFTLDGFVGPVANRTDPYEGGSRPHPFDYYRSNGEFLPLVPPLHEEYLNVTLTPHDTWGPVGVYYLPSGEWPGDATAQSPEDCGYPPDYGGIIRLVICPTVSADSAKPIHIRLGRSARESASAGAGWILPAMNNPDGHLSLFYPLWFPTGSPGFTMCSEPLVLEYEHTGETHAETVQDCDVIAPWREP
ncbi:MAG TPA: hypothetical protein VM889_04490 [Candidatus Thermoplasmatota archaeon]|nr:hypothetical protein [Candidatus Thermoplasmatota archaeon]